MSRSGSGCHGALLLWVVFNSAGAARAKARTRLLAGIGAISASRQAGVFARAVLRSATSRTPHSGFSARKLLIESCVARRGVLAVALERAVDEQPAAVAQIASGAGEEILRHRARARCAAR